MNAMTGRSLGKQLADVLGLPPQVKWFELRVAVDKAVTITCEHYVHRNAVPGLMAVLSKYEVVERRAPADAGADHELILAERARSDHR